MDYLRKPREIYDRSFAIVRAQADLARFSDAEQELVIRLIHASGMIDIVDDLVISESALVAGRAALANGAPVICDVNMVAMGIIARMLPPGVKTHCGLDLPHAHRFARDNVHTRSAGGIDALRHKLDGAIITIGNAPTALFHLLEMVEREGIQPALVLGFPVGFVGAEESKEALIANKFGLPFIALKGRRGGSAMAAAAVNALVAGLGT